MQQCVRTRRHGITRAPAKPAVAAAAVAAKSPAVSRIASYVHTHIISTAPHARSTYQPVEGKVMRCNFPRARARYTCVCECRRHAARGTQLITACVLSVSAAAAAAVAACSTGTQAQRAVPLFWISVSLHTSNRSHSHTHAISVFARRTASKNEKKLKHMNRVIRNRAQHDVECLCVRVSAFVYRVHHNYLRARMVHDDVHGDYFHNNKKTKQIMHAHTATYPPHAA